MRTFISKWGNEIAYTDNEKKIAQLLEYGFREITEDEASKTEECAKGTKKTTKRKGPSKQGQAEAKGIKE